ncbi:MAG TPA: hypothetical protein VL463_20770 [Kofleriaceae bacterium]|nr:hypothetical protein [Kofleriaceae bacterium]
MERAYLCLGCRLLQSATVQCVQCGGTTVAPADLVRELLAYRDLSLAAERDLGLITALLAGGSIAMPILFPFALVSLGALAVRAPMRRIRARAQKEHRVEPIRLPPPVAAARSVAVEGAPKRFRGTTVRSRWDGAEVIAEEIAIETDEGVIVRHAIAAPFFVDAGSERVLIRGHVRLSVAAAWTIGNRPIGSADALPHELGLPADLRVRGTARRTRLDERANVIAIGPQSFEALPEHAALREAGTTRVLVGEPGAPVLIATPAAFAQI